MKTPQLAGEAVKKTKSATAAVKVEKPATVKKPRVRKPRVRKSRAKVKPPVIAAETPTVVEIVEKPAPEPLKAPVVVEHVASTVGSAADVSVVHIELTLPQLEILLAAANRQFKYIEDELSHAYQASDTQLVEVYEPRISVLEPLIVELTEKRRLLKNLSRPRK